MTKTTARPAQLAPVRIGKGVKVHLGYLSSIKGPNGEPRYCSWCPASRGRDGQVVAGEATAEDIDCRSCQRQADAETMQRAAATAQAMIRAAEAVDRHGLDGESALVLAAIPATGTATPQDLAAASTGIAQVTTNDLGVVAVTTGAYDKSRLVCLSHFPDPDTILGEFERDELEPDETCHECGKILGQPTIDLHNPGAVLALMMSSLIRADAIEVNLHDDGVEIVGPSDIRLGVIHGTFTPTRVAMYLCLGEQDIRDRRNATSD